MAKLYEHMLIIYQVAVTMGGCVYRMCYGYTFRDSFKGLTTLKTLRMKQKDGHKPAPGFDYSALAPLNNSLEELYLIGTPAFSSVFTEFHRLHTLSIGGSDCDIPELTDTQCCLFQVCP
ncbi:hypothetical protein EB796_004376 [Bugula neritina]|uniref:Uncharacterized protein n=1 Tax=Bugula neritina TaxID=10212 RepID=A0A7J7KIQ7_BUGNE|nr:hypothetical protein EB796_004376 [Bugula neritina]